MEFIVKVKIKMLGKIINVTMISYKLDLSMLVMTTLVNLVFMSGIVHPFVLVIHFGMVTNVITWNILVVHTKYWFIFHSVNKVMIYMYNIWCVLILVHIFKKPVMLSQYVYHVVLKSLEVLSLSLCQVQFYLLIM